MMKKTFIIPAISVCSFSAEDIITESAASTAADAVNSELKKAASAVYTVSWNSMKE